MNILKIIAVVAVVWYGASSFAMSDINAPIIEIEQELKDLEAGAVDNTNVLRNRGGTSVKSLSQSLQELAKQGLLSAKLTIVDNAIEASKKRLAELKALKNQSANVKVETQVLQTLHKLKRRLRMAQALVRMEKLQDDMENYRKEPLGDSTTWKKMAQTQMGLDQEQETLAGLEQADLAEYRSEESND
jgi:hypothetical protein